MEFRDVLCEHGSARYAHERSRENSVRFYGLPPADDSMGDRIKHRNFLDGAIHGSSVFRSGSTSGCDCRTTRFRGRPFGLRWTAFHSGPHDSRQLQVLVINRQNRYARLLNFPAGVCPCWHPSCSTFIHCLAFIVCPDSTR